MPPMTIQSQQPPISQQPNEQRYNAVSKVLSEHKYNELNNIHIDIQDYLRVMNFLYDKTKNNFISLDTVLTSLKPFLYKKK